jgi:hypothetical protein
MLLDMDAIGNYIAENIYNNVSPENVLLGVIEKFEIPMGYENGFAVNCLRQIIVYHVTQKVNSELTKLATDKSIRFEKQRRGK